MSIRMGVSGSGYETVRDTETGDWCYVHRLTALVHYDTEDLRDADVHHVDGNPWNNDPVNLQPLDSGHHRSFNLPGPEDPAVLVG